MTICNEGFHLGQCQIPWDSTEIQEKWSQLSPSDKGKFRKAYWKGRLSWLLDEIRGCPRYMRFDDMKILHQRLETVYYQTLVGMYGKVEADRFLRETREPLKTQENGKS